MTASFRRSPFGYARAEVDEYIGQLRGEIDALREQTHSLEEQIAQQKKQIEEYRAQERYISGALLDAQNRAVQIEQRAQENYDRAIMRLAEDSKIWEDRIQKNKERLIALDNMIESFLSGVKAEMGAAHADSGEDWKSALEEADRIMLAAQTVRPGGEEKKDDADVKDAIVTAKETGEVPEENRGTPVRAPQVDGDIHNLYWRLKHLEDGDTPPRQTVDPREDAKKGGAKPAEEKTDAPETAANKADKEMYMPAQNEQERLTSILSELGILPADEEKKDEKKPKDRK